MSGVVLWWVRHPPHTTVHLSEGLRAATMAIALGTPLRILFVGEGVRALVRDQEPYRYAPPIAKLLADVVDRDRPALVHLPSLARRGLDLASLDGGVPVEGVDDARAADWVLQASRVVPW